MPRDDFHGVWPAAFGIVDMLIDSLLTAEAHGPFDDGTDWADVAIDIPAGLVDWQRRMWRHAIVVLIETEEIDDRDLDRLLSALRGRPALDDPGSPLIGDPRGRIVSMLRVAVEFEHLFDVE